MSFRVSSMMHHGPRAEYSSQPHRHRNLDVPYLHTELCAVHTKLARVTHHADGVDAAVSIHRSSNYYCSSC